MKTKNTNIIMQNKNILLIALVVGLILLLPWLAMQFTDKVAWSPFDFALAGALLFGAGVTFELLTRQARSLIYRAAMGLALATALFLVWANLAVGVIGSEDDPVNLLVFGVLAVFMIGALLARFRSQGMGRVLLATALAQALFAVIALFVGKGLDAFEILIVNGFFMALWVGSAWLFHRADAAPDRRLG